MAPITISTNTFSAPLADFFFIAGIESSRIFETSNQVDATPPSSPGTTDSIDEHGLFKTKSTPHLSSSPDGSPYVTDSPQTPASPEIFPGATLKRTRYSYDARKSIGSVIGLQDFTATPSNRSSATVRPLPCGQRDSYMQPTQKDATFDQALRKFASERDSFLEQIQFSAGQLAQPDRPRPKAKTQRMSVGGHNRENSHGGSLRKRLSTINLLSRQSTSTKRSSNRISKRISGYNSVIPAPQEFQSQKSMHPLKRSYEPVLLDHYPAKTMVDECQRRNPFPDYVPMFIFPNDVNITAADERPRSTWHGFAMTNGDGSKLYGMCLIMWIPLKASAAEELEIQCEQWRNANMSDEEREMARDLGDRLAKERARLSELLTILPTLESGSVERETHEEDISTVEERIHLMADALRPVRHAAASKIDGLTECDTGFWIPRAYGVLGRDPSYMSFWKEWLRAIAVPMANGGILRVPASSPRVGLWQPLEKYVVNLCTEAPSPMTSITQVEIAVRELRLYARKEAQNEIPGSRSTDLYPLFRCLEVQDIVVLMEYVLCESKIILLSSHTSMLHLASSAITQLLYPLQWAGIFIPVLPARLLQALEAPCPYIVGIERRYENLQLPENDYVLVDLDQGVIEATAPPTSLPRQQRRKLISILQLAAPHKIRYGVPLGPPKYAIEAFPFNTFASENEAVFDYNAPRSTLAHLANINSTSFGANAIPDMIKTPPLFNAFSQPPRSPRSFSGERPPTRTTSRESATSSTNSATSTSSPAHHPHPLSRHGSGLTIQSTLKEKRSGIFDMSSYMKRNSSLHVVPLATNRMSNINNGDRTSSFASSRRPSLPFNKHSYAPSVSTMGSRDVLEGSTYAPSVYAQSSLAGSSVMALNAVAQPVKNTATTNWREGHCLQWQANTTERLVCSVCNEKSDHGVYKCSGCGMISHSHCSEQICLVCPAAFHSDQIMTAFVRCFASLFFTYRKFLTPATAEEQKSGNLFGFNMNGFINSVPHDHAEYLSALRDIQAFNHFIHTRSTKPPHDPSIKLFDDLITSKRTRTRAASNFFTSSKPKPFNLYADSTSSKSTSTTPFLSDTSDHIWRTAAAPSVVSRSCGGKHMAGSSEEDEGGGSGKSWVGRVPAKLEPKLMRAPRAVQGAPRVEVKKGRIRRKDVPGGIGGGLGGGKGMLVRSKSEGVMECLR